MAQMDGNALRALMCAGLAGDARAHQQFLLACAAMLRPWLRARLRGDGPGIAEDVLQEVMISLHTRRETYDPGLPVLPWVYAIARHRLIDHWRRMKRAGIPVGLDDAPELAAEQSGEEDGDPTRDVARLLDRLPPKQARAIRLVKLEEKSVREAAQATGWSESDIKISIHRGLKQLASQLRQERPA